ncbi:hypothetical protein BGX21_004224 [Mortierella sp. AD011]|nr:hypothetical protein BGX21_004224 [Mortierella sp. AD011]
MILLVLLTATYCLLRRRKQGLPFFLGINLKGSKFSLGRGGSDSGSQGVGIGQRTSDIGNVESGYGHAAVGVVPAEKSHEGEIQNPAQGPAPTQTAEAVAQDQMSTGELVDTTSMGVAAAAAAVATAAEAGSRSRTDPGSTVIDIPELSESHRFSGNTQDDTIHSNNTASGVNDRQQTPADSLAAKSIESAPLIGAVEGKHSRLYRAASAPNRGVITTIRPEHHQQQMQQLQFEQDLEAENQRNQLSPQEQAYLSFGKQSGIGLVSNTDAFINPGPPPLPPLSRTRSNRNSKKGYTQPIHIRAQRDGASSSTAQEHAAKSEAHNPGLYGYM